MEAGQRLLTLTNITDVTPVQNEQLGALGATADNRLFRYAQAGASPIANGLLAVVAPIVANHTNQAFAASSLVAINTNTVVLTIGATAITQNQYAEGYLVINSGTGAGYSYKINGNTAGASGTFTTVILREPLQAAISNSTATKGSLVPSQFVGLVTSATTSHAVGVAYNTVPAGSFGWFQTYGPCSAQSDASPALQGQAIKQSVTTPGNVTVSAASTDYGLGQALNAGVSAEYRQVWLAID